MRYVSLLMLAILLVSTNANATESQSEAGSAFSKLEVGMTIRQVETLVGKSYDCEYRTNRGLFTVTSEMVCHYIKGDLVFNRGEQTLTEIHPKSH